MELDTLIHLIAGGAAGTVGAIVTCPLEVVKTRLQSSTFMSLHSPKNKVTDGSGLKNKINPAFRPPEQRRTHSTTILRPRRSHVYGMSAYTHSSVPKSMSIYQCLKHIIQNEGFRGLFKGLGPNIVGVAPSRAIYFCTYSHSKQVLNSTGFFKPDSPVIHIVSAASAGFVSSTATNPIWFVKTRLQLDCDSKHKMTVRECVKRIYETSGIRGFYKGITASYFGISETVVHFVIYEALKRKLIESRHKEKLHEKTSRDFVEFMLAGATSKTIASCVAYPHEVARTRLREEGSKYRTFWQTLFLVWKEEGKAGLYRGLATQLVRQIPNTAIMMSTYELIVYVLSINLNAKFYLNSTRNGNVSTKTHNNNN